MNRHIVAFLFTIVSFGIPAFASAATLNVSGVIPSTTVGAGTQVSFYVTPSGFSSTPTYQVVDSFGGGVSTVNLSSVGAFSWTPNKDDIGSHGLTITATDASGNSASASVTLTVIDRKVTISSLSPDTATAMYGNEMSFSFAGEGFTSPTYSVSDSFNSSSITSANLKGDNTFHWTPVPQDTGVHQITITARDYQNNTASTTQQFTVYGMPTLTFPNLTSRNVSVPANSTLAFTATTTNLYKPTFTVSDSFYSTGTSTALSIDQTSGLISWTPVYNDLGTHQVTFAATDSTGRGATSTVMIQVTSPAATPTLVSYTISATPTVIQTTATTPKTTTTTSSTSNSTTTTSTIHRSTYTFSSYLQTGSRGEVVGELQKLLTTLGYYNYGEITNYFGGVTAAAVSSYQAARSIEQTGTVGPKTRASLNAE